MIGKGKNGKSLSFRTSILTERIHLLPYFELTHHFELRNFHIRTPTLQSIRLFLQILSLSLPPSVSLTLLSFQKIRSNKTIIVFFRLSAIHNFFSQRESKLNDERKLFRRTVDSSMLVTDTFKISRNVNYQTMVDNANNNIRDRSMQIAITDRRTE